MKGCEATGSSGREISPLSHSTSSRWRNKMATPDPKAEIVGEAIHAEVEIAAPPEKVFQALTDPAQLQAWWGSQEKYKTANWEMDLKPGGRWRCFAHNQSTGV